MPRHFKANELEFYGQDVWRATSNLTLTLGLRYTLLQPPYETDGNQVSPSPGLGDFFNQRASAMSQGQTYAAPITFNLSGKANGQQPYWNWDYKDIAPRFAFAYSPNFSNGVLQSLFGSAGKTTESTVDLEYTTTLWRRVVNSYDREGSLGLTTSCRTHPMSRPPIALRDLSVLPPFPTLSPAR